MEASNFFALALAEVGFDGMDLIFFVLVAPFGIIVDGVLGRVGLRGFVNEPVGVKDGRRCTLGEGVVVDILLTTRIDQA